MLPPKLVFKDIAMVSAKKPLQNLNRATIYVVMAACLFVPFCVSRPALAEELAPPQRTSLQLAPMKFTFNSGGELSYVRRYSKYGDSQTSDQAAGVRYFNNLQVYSYFWQPWFSRVNGGIGIDVDVNRSSAGGYSSSKSTNLSGMVNATLNLIPKSRFPFEASIYRRSGRSKSGISSNDSNFQTSNINLSQGYSSRNGWTNAHMGYLHSLNDNSRSSLSKKDTFIIGLSHQIYALQYVMFDANVIRDVRPDLDYQSLVSTAISSYTYRPDPTLSALGTLNVYRSNYRQRGVENYALSEQFNAIGSWRPNDSALTVTSSARLYRFTNNAPVANSSIYQRNSLANITLGATYYLTKGVRAIGSVVIEDVSGKQVVTSVASLTSTKTFTDITNIAGFVYKRYISGSLNNQSSSSTDRPEAARSSQGIALSAGHSLTNNTLLYGGRLVSNINQVVSSSMTTNSQTAPSTRLATNGSLAWAGVDEERRSQTTIRMTGSDSRNMTNSETARPPAQLFNLQILRNEGLTKYQSLIGNLTYQIFRTAASVSAQGTRSVNSSGGLTYKHARLFNISQLTFQSIVKADNNRLSNGSNEATVSWDNNLMYVIGKLQVKLDARTATTNKSRQSWVIFTLKRQF